MRKLLAIGTPSVPTRGSSKRWPYWAARLYEARRGRSGRVYWHATQIMGHPRRGRGILQKDAEALSLVYKCPILDIRHGSLVEPVLAMSLAKGVQHGQVR